MCGGKTIYRAGIFSTFSCFAAEDTSLVEKMFG